MDAFLVRLLIGIGIIWLTQIILGAMKIKEPANQVIFILVLIVAIVLIATGGLLFK